MAWLAPSTALQLPPAGAPSGAFTFAGNAAFTADLALPPATTAREIPLATPSGDFEFAQDVRGFNFTGLYCAPGPNRTNFSFPPPVPEYVVILEDFDAVGGYSPPTGNATAFTWSDEPLLLEHFDNLNAYTAPSAGSTDFVFCDPLWRTGETSEPAPVVNAEFTGAYISPLGASVQGVWGSPALGANLYARCVLPWAASPTLKHTALSAWDRTAPVGQRTGLVWETRPFDVGNAIDLTWDQTTPIDSDSLAVTWSQAPAGPHATVQIPWTTLTAQDVSTRLSWANAVQQLTLTADLDWLVPEAKDRVTHWLWAATQIDEMLAHDAEMQWQTPASLNPKWRLPWGLACVPWAITPYKPTTSWPPPTPTPTPTPQAPQDAAGVTLALTCVNDLIDKDPKRLRLVFGHLCPLPLTGRTLMNNMLIVKLPERTPLPCAAVSLRADRTAFAWSAQFTFLSQDALDLIKPNNDNLAEVEITLNGYTWVIAIETWQQSTQFPGKAWTATGSSPSILLAQPYAPSQDYRQGDNTISAQQVCLDLLQFTGWSLNWAIDDWVFPATTFSFSRKTPMAIMLEIVQSAGAYLQTDTATKTLHVKRHYTTAPWAWDSVPVDHTLPASFALKARESYQRGPRYNRVFVMGTRPGGRHGQVTQSATAGDRVAPNVTSPLQVDSLQNRYRGLATLAQARNIVKTNWTLPLVEDVYEPGLLAVGDYVDVNGVVGLVDAVRLQARVENQSNKHILVVRQDIGVETNG